VETPSIFSSVLAQDKEDPLIKYRFTYEGASKADVASIEQAKAFRAILVDLIAKNNAIAPTPKIVAVEGFSPFDSQGRPTVVTATARFIPIEEMIQDGFPEWQPARLHFVFDYGPPVEDAEGSASGVTRGRASKIVEVADTIRNYYNPGANKSGHVRILKDITQ
jgi:hypothetical protein